MNLFRFDYRYVRTAYCSIVFHCHEQCIYPVRGRYLNTPYLLDKQHNLTAYNTTIRYTEHNDTHNTIQPNDNIVIFTYKTMAEVLGAVASAVAVVEAAGKVWSTGWKYYKVRIPANKFEPQLIVNNFYMGLGC